jgi:hypothetical protein
MNSETLKALKGSIQKWQNIVEGCGVDMGIANCPLCRVFKSSDPTSCFGCPVMEKTGKPGCAGSPYRDWAMLHYDQIIARTATVQNNEDSLAVDELNFLKSLLP